MLGVVNQLEGLATQLNDSLHNGSIALEVNGQSYYPNTDEIQFIGDVQCQPGQGVLRFGCGNYLICDIPPANATGEICSQ